MHLGLKLKILRLSKGLTQEELAERVNKTRPLISNIEQRGKVGYQTLQDICKVLDVKPEEVMNQLSDPPGYYQTLNTQKQNETIGQLQREIENLRLLVSSQQENINFLKEKINRLEQSPKKN